jgi:hypothetical protein
VPIVRILLRFGITWREVSELTKRVYVEVAQQDYAERRRPVNTSRLAVMTGLTRKEVRRIRDLEERGELLEGIRTGAADAVLQGWWRDPEFINSHGAPAQLPAEGKKRSFQSLVRKYGGDLPVGAVLKELERVGAIAEQPSGLLEVRKDHYAQIEVSEPLVAHVTVALETVGQSLVSYVESRSGQPPVHH